MSLPRTAPPCHRPSRARRAAILLGFLPFTGAGAAVRCIDSDVQLKSMFDAALASADTLEEVRLKTGNFLLAAGEIGYFGVLQGSNKTLLVSGGWSGAPGQCSTRDGDPASTLLWGLGQRPVFAINASSTFSGSIVIENLSFGGGLATVAPTASCLSLGEQNGGQLGIRVDRVRVEACATAAGIMAPAVSLSGSGPMIVRNSLVAGNDAGLSVPVSLAAKGSVGYVLNNTIANNVSANVNGFAGISASGNGAATLTLANNLFAGNVATTAPRIDIRLGPDVALVNNRYTGLFGNPVSNSGGSSGAAGFGENDFELAPESTARDAGAFFVPVLQGTLDLAGRPRVQGSAVDLGALEYVPLLKDGFE